MAKVCEWMIPVRTEKVKIQYLEPHLLDTPSVALEQAGRFLRRMLKKSWKMVSIATEQHFIPCNVNEERFQSLARKEEKIDRWQLELTNYLVQVTLPRTLRTAVADHSPAPALHPMTRSGSRTIRKIS